MGAHRDRTHLTRGCLTCPVSSQFTPSRGDSSPGDGILSVTVPMGEREQLARTLPLGLVQQPTGHADSELQGCGQRGEARAALRAWQVTGRRTERATGGASSVVLPEHRGESGPPGRGGGAGGGRLAPRVWLSSGPGRLLSHAPCRPSGTLRGGRVAGEAGRDVPRDRHTHGGGADGWAEPSAVREPALHREDRGPPQGLGPLQGRGRPVRTGLPL